MTENSEADELADANFEVIAEHATAIGLICIYTAMLDSALAKFLERLVRVSPTEAACLLSASEDLSRRCTILINLAYANGPEEGGWTECVVDLLNFVKNQIAPRRNRYVHDDWRVSEGRIIRADRRVKAHKEQAFKPVRIIRVSESIASTLEMHTVVDAITSTLVHITFLGLDFEKWRDGGMLPKPNDKAILLSKSILPIPTPLAPLGALHQFAQ